MQRHRNYCVIAIVDTQGSLHEFCQRMSQRLHAGVLEEMNQIAKGAFIKSEARRPDRKAAKPCIRHAAQKPFSSSGKSFANGVWQREQKKRRRSEREKQGRMRRPERESIYRARVCRYGNLREKKAKKGRGGSPGKWKQPFSSEDYSRRRTSLRPIGQVFLTFFRALLVLDAERRPRHGVESTHRNLAPAYRADAIGSVVDRSEGHFDALKLFGILTGLAEEIVLGVRGGRSVNGIEPFEIYLIVDLGFGARRTPRKLVAAFT